MWMVVLIHRGPGTCDPGIAQNFQAHHAGIVQRRKEGHFSEEKADIFNSLVL
jgi:hypothetical protein